MRRARRRPIHYTTITLHDGTVLSARPIRKPPDRTLKREGLSIDPDGVTIEYATAGMELSDVTNEARFRSLKVIAIYLNGRRALRELVLPPIAESRKEIQAMREQLERIEGLLLKTQACKEQA